MVEESEMVGATKQKPSPRRRVSAETGGEKVNRDSPMAANRRINRKTESVQSAILEAAAAVFASKGYYLTKLSDISSSLGMHVTALRYHFPTKDGIAEAIANRVARNNLERLEEALAELGPEASSREKFTAAIHTYMRVTAENLTFIAAHGNIVNQLPEPAREAHYHLLHDYLSIWRQLVAEAHQRGELAEGLNPSIATQVVLGSVIWSREWYKPELGSPDRIADEMIRTLFGGLLRDPVTAGRAARKTG